MRVCSGVMLERCFATLVMLCLLGAGLRGQAPANNTCATAIPIGNTVILGSNVGATTGPDPLPSCQTVTGDVWYSWVAPCNGAWTVSTVASRRC